MSLHLKYIIQAEFYKENNSVQFGKNFSILNK